MNHVYVGIDVGKNFSSVCVLNHEGAQIFVDRIATFHIDAWLKLLARFKEREIHAVFEVGAHYDWMYDMLLPHCRKVVVLAPPEKKPRKKTDRIDAAHLARDLWRGALTGIFVPPASMRLDRRLVARLHSLSAQISKTKALIREILYTSRLTCPHSDVSGAKAQAWLEQVALPQLEEQSRLFAEQLLEQLKLLEKHYNANYVRAKQRVEHYADAKLARTIPGFGPLVTLAILCAMGRIGRFETSDQFASYFGLCGRVDQSGDRFQIFGITRRGNNHVRWLLGQAVTHLIRIDPKALRRYKKLRRKKKAKVARVALMRWITTVLWRMLNANEPYRINGKKGNYRIKCAA